MRYHNANSLDSMERRNPGRHRKAIVFACLWPLCVAGCGIRASASRSAPPIDIIRGKDSAGAIIELEKRGDDLTQARVVDVVLGTGEAEIVTTTDRKVEFTIEFPAGAMITYVGRIEDPIVSGTWHQHMGAVFGEDFGTWEAQNRLANMP